MVAESPVLTLARLLGGVVLMQGPLGHQILGQLLIMNTNEVALAGAAAVVAASSGERNAAVQVALRTAAPALAVRGLLLKQERRIERREAILAERERKIEERDRAIQKRDLAVKEQAKAIGRRTAATTALETEKRDLQTEVDRLIAELRSGVTGPPSEGAPPGEARKTSSQKRPPRKPQV